MSDLNISDTKLELAILDKPTDFVPTDFVPNHIPTYTERFNFYTQYLLNLNSSYQIPFDDYKSYLTHKQDECLVYDETNYNEYGEKYLKIYPKKIAITLNDCIRCYKFPTLNKVRLINNRANGIIIRSIERWRHWDPIYDKSNIDNIRWEDKIPKVAYRGATTGNGDRFNFVKRYINTEHDIGLSALVGPYDHSSYQSYVKTSLSLTEFYSYKYNVSIEGNEKDSGINWKLASKSVVLMKKPTYESWLMESKLIPFYHYVPLNDNLDNLQEMYEWCLANDDLCQKIVSNANQFMQQFANNEKEEKLEQLIINKYLQMVDFV